MPGPIDVLFATNREVGADVNGMPTFSDEAASPPGNPVDLVCAVATVSGIDARDAAKGQIERISGLCRGGFNQEQLAPLLRSDKDILVFIHGADNSFKDAITRAAYNKTWLALSGLVNNGENADFDVIAFTWPGRSYGDANFLLGELDPIGDYIDYRHDQQQARLSPFHLALFLKEIEAVRARLEDGRRLNLLCHSMGNYALAGAVESLFRQAEAPARPIFDRILLAAADEPATSFAAPGGGASSISGASAARSRSITTTTTC